MAFGQWDPKVGLWTDPASKSVFAKGIGGWVDPEGKWWKGGKQVDPSTLDGATLRQIGQFAEAAQRAYGGAPEGGAGAPSSQGGPGVGGVGVTPPRMNASPAPMPQPPMSQMAGAVAADPMAAFGQPHPHAPLLADSFKTLAKSLVGNR